MKGCGFLDDCVPDYLLGRGQWLTGVSAGLPGNLTVTTGLQEVTVPCQKKSLAQNLP